MGLSVQWDPDFRQRPEDFLVEEVSDFQPEGSGGHLALWIQKNHLDHRALVSRLCDAFGVPQAAVGWAGMKDRVAVAMQWMTVETEKDATLLADSDVLRIVHASRHPRRLRMGHLTGNRFIIRIRGVDPTLAPLIHRRLMQVATHGLPNQYGTQRFGYRGVNDVLGAHLLRSEWEALLEAWLGTGAPPWPDHELDMRTAFSQGDHQLALQGWSDRWHPERRAISRLIDGLTPAEVVKAVPRSMRLIWSDAALASIFNAVLAQRLVDGRVTEMPGDVYWSHERFLDRAGPGTPIQTPTGPLWGSKMRAASGPVDELERQALCEA